MFTGIIEAVGVIRRIERTHSGARLSVLVPEDWELRPGESVCVSGICLTVTAFKPKEASFDAASATLAKTTLALWRNSTRVNLERAMKADSRMGGHWVAGHVEGTARLLRRKGSGGSSVWELEAPAGAPKLVQEGSVALDGVSLTVSALRGAAFEVCLIPQTLSATTLSARREGDRLNLETDLLAKYARPQRQSGVTEAFLREHGFLT